MARMLTDPSAGEMWGASGSRRDRAGPGHSPSRAGLRNEGTCPQQTCARAFTAPRVLVARGGTQTAVGRTGRRRRQAPSCGLSSWPEHARGRETDNAHSRPGGLKDSAARAARGPRGVRHVSPTRAGATRPVGVSMRQHVRSPDRDPPNKTNKQTKGQKSEPNHGPPTTWHWGKTGTRRGGRGGPSTRLSPAPGRNGTRLG